MTITPPGESQRPVAWARRLRRHLGIVLALKLALIALLFLFFFSSSHRPAIDAGRVSDRFLLDR